MSRRYQPWQRTKAKPPVGAVPEGLADHQLMALEQMLGALPRGTATIS